MRVVVTGADDAHSGSSVTMEAHCNGDFCGSIDFYRLARRVAGRAAWTIGSISVLPKFRRRGVATKLYEAAATYACARRGRLASTNRAADAHSNDFWQKQVAKGRARAVRRRHGMPPAYILTSCPVTTLAGRRRR